MMSKLMGLHCGLEKFLTMLAPIGDVVIRVYVAMFFFKSALTKIQNFDQTIFLFTYEYQVPLLSPELAAYAGTAAELILPVMLVLGLFGRYAALGLFFFNIVAVFSYPFLWTEDGTIGMMQHIHYGLLLLFLCLHGLGKIALDNMLCKLFCKDKACD